MTKSLAATLSMPLLLLAAAAPAQSPQSADIMLISSHGDDEGIFGGGVLAYYARVRGLKVLHVMMVGDTVGDTHRVDQLKQAVNVYAGVTEGSMSDGYYVAKNIRVKAAGFPDCCGWKGPDSSWKIWGKDTANPTLGRKAASYVVAREIRRLRPRIVLSAHSLNGDYGHSNHKATAIAAYEGVIRAADPNEQIDGLPPYEVEKLFLRGTQVENTITLTGLPANGGLQPFFHDYWERRVFNGSSTRQVTNLGLRQHKSEFYLEPQMATVYCGTLEGTNPAPVPDWDVIRDGHAAETWMLFRSKGGQLLPQSSFTINGVTYTNWARGDFWNTPIDFTVLESAPPSAPVGTDVSVVDVGGASFQNVACRTWQRFDGGSNSPSRQYVEEYQRGDRYKTGQYLVLKDAPNSRLLIDLTGGTVRQSADVFDAHEVAEWESDRLPTWGQPVYQITGLDKRVSGRNVRAVFFREGQSIRRDTTPTGWEETDVTGNVIFRFRQTYGDMWSVIMQDDSRGVRLHIDLHRGWIRNADRTRPDFADQYRIVTAR